MVLVRGNLGGRDGVVHHGFLSKEGSDAEHCKPRQPSR